MNNGHKSGRHGTSIKLIQWASSENWIRPLALYHLQKATYNNSVVFDYKSRMQELASRFDISIKTLYRYYDVFRFKGLIFDFPRNRNNLHLISIKKLKQRLSDRRKTVIFIEPEDDLWNVSCKLFGKLIEYHIRKMAYCRAIQERGRHSKTKVIEECEGAPTPLFSLSQRSTAKLLNINERTVIKVLNTLQELDIIELHPTPAKKITNEILNVKTINDYPGYKFSNTTGTFIQFGTRIELLQYPVKIPKIPYRSYIKHMKSNQCKKYNNYKVIPPLRGAGG